MGDRVLIVILSPVTLTKYFVSDHRQHFFLCRSYNFWRKLVGIRNSMFHRNTLNRPFFYRHFKAGSRYHHGPRTRNSLDIP